MSKAAGDFCKLSLGTRAFQDAKLGGSQQQQRAETLGQCPDVVGENLNLEILIKLWLTSVLRCVDCQCEDTLVVTLAAS
jgi:hypothetical protein